MQGFGKSFGGRVSVVLLTMMLVGSSFLAACGSSSSSTSSSSASSSSASSSSSSSASSSAASAGSTATSTEQAVATAIAKATGSPNVPQLQTVASLAPPVAQNGAAQPGADTNATLTYSQSTENYSYDPGVDSEGGVYMLVWSPLLALTPDNKVAQSGAQSMQISNGGKTYTFTLRKMMYSDGTQVTAQDYAYAMQRICDPNVGGTYSNVYFDIVGCQAWRTADPTKTSQADLAKMQQTVENSIKAVDPNTLQIQLQSPAGYFPYVLTLWLDDPVRQDLVQQGGKNWWQNTSDFIGDGPFKVVKHVANQEWVLQRNPDFTLGKAGVNQIDIRIIQTPATALLAYEQGELDYYDVLLSQYQNIVGNSTLKSELKDMVEPSTYWIQLDNGDPPFNNLKVRQAFSYAMNRPLFIQQVNHGIGDPAGTLLFNGLPGYQTTFQQSYDPTKAKQLLAQAGYPNGKGFPSIDFYFDNSNDVSKNEAVFWASQFKQLLGVNIVPTPMDPVELDNLDHHKSAQVKMAVREWFQDYPDAQDWLSLLFADNSGLAPRGWNDPHFNDLTNKADASSGSQAATYYQQADAYLAQQAVVLFFQHPSDLSLFKPYVKGYYQTNGQVYGSGYTFTFAPGAIYEVHH